MTVGFQFQEWLFMLAIQILKSGLQQSNDYFMEDRQFGNQLTNLIAAGQARQQRSRSFVELYQQQREKTHCLIGKKMSKAANNNKSLFPEKSQLPIEDKPIIEGPQSMVPEYCANILVYLRGQEKHHYNLWDYLAEEQRFPEASARARMINRVSQLHQKFKMFPETIFTVVSYIDQYLSKVEVPYQQLELVAISAFFLAAKYEQTYQVPHLKQLAQYTDYAYSQAQIVDMEANIVNRLNFNLIVNSTFSFFDCFSRLLGLESKNYFLCQYVLQLSMLNTRFLEFAPSLLGASCIYLIKKIRKTEASWDDKMTAIVGYEEQELRKCAKELCVFLENVGSLTNCQAIKHKFSLAQYHQVTRIRLERKQK